MDNEGLNRINVFLVSKGLNSDTISKSKLNQLMKIDSAIQQRVTRIQESEKQVKESVINISTIALDTGIARKTFYNNDVLRLYVEAYSTQDEEKVATASELERLKAKIADQEQQIQQFLLRDVESEDLLHDKELLLKDISHCNARIQTLEEHVAKLQEENDQLRKEKIIPFPKKK